MSFLRLPLLENESQSGPLISPLKGFRETYSIGAFER